MRISSLSNSRLRLVWPILTVAALILAHIWLIAPIVQNGDGAVYNEQIENRDLTIRTPHVGYMVLGIVSNALLPFDTDRNLNMMCLAFASLGATALGFIVRKYGATWAAVVFSVLMVFALRPYLRGAVLAEVDGVACALILVATAAWLYGQRAIAGIAFGSAMLVTPLTALSLPVIVLTTTGKKKPRSFILGHVRDVLVFGIFALAVYAPFVLHYWQDYWHGGRGLLRAPRQPWDTAEHVMRSVRFLSSSTLPWIALGLAGLISQILRRGSIASGTLVALACAALFGERFLDVPVQLPQACLLIALCALTVNQIPSKSLAVWVFSCLWAVSAIPTYLDQHDEIHRKVELNETYRAMAKQTPQFMVIGLEDSWIDGLPFERLIYHRTKLGLGLDYRQFAGSSRSIARTHRDYALWLLSPAPPGTMTAFQQGWRREFRNVRGHNYEVWLPAS